MKHYNLIVIGGDGAGMGSASQARRINKELSIAVFEKGQHVSYAGCGIPYYLSGVIKEQESLLAIDIEEFSKKKNIQININTEVKSVDFDKKNIVVQKNRNEVNEETISYDKLIIATGASPSVPPIEGVENPGTFVLRSLADGLSLKNIISKESTKSVILIGGGFINLELAEAFRKLGMDVTLLERLNSVAAQSSTEIQEKITEELIKNKVKVITEINISKIEYTNNQTVIHTDGTDYIADFTVISTGVHPNTAFLKNSNLNMLKNGAIVINEKSETNIENVFSAGDCATVKNLLTEEIDYIPMATTANKQGRVAGLQAADIKSEFFPGSIGSQMFKVFELEVAKTGFNLKDAEKHGIEAEEKINIWHSRAGYYPGSAELIVKLTVSKDKGIIIGGEICGPDYAAIRINTIVAAITGKMKINDLAYLDTAYAPPFSPVWDPVIAAAQKFIKRIPV